MSITVKQLPSGYYFIRGNGPGNFAQVEVWPCSESELRAGAFPEAGENFLQQALFAARSTDQ